MSNVVVIGAGLAGLASALMLADNGHRVRIVARGWGGLLLSKGTIDILGWSGDGSTTRDGSATRDGSFSSDTIGDGNLSTAAMSGRSSERDQPVHALAPALADFIAAHPEHPYAAIGAERVLAGAQWLTGRLPFFSSVSRSFASVLPLPSSAPSSPSSAPSSPSSAPSSPSSAPLSAIAGEDASRAPSKEMETSATLTNKLLPTAIGSVQPSAFVPDSMLASALTAGEHYLIVGISNLKDFHPQLVADNLAASPYVPVHTRAVSITLPIQSDHSGYNVDATGTAIARCLDSTNACNSLSGNSGSSYAGSAHCSENDGIRDGECTTRSRSNDSFTARSPEFISLAQQLKDAVHPGEIVLVPAVLGLNSQTYTALSKEIGVPVGEIPLPPPSIPGRRLHDYLVHECRERRIDIMLNAEAVGVTPDAHVSAQSNSAIPVAASSEPSTADLPLIRSVAVRVAGGVKQLRADAVVYAGGGFESGALERDSFGRVRDTLCSLAVWSPDGEIFGSGVRVDRSMRPLALRSDGSPSSAIFANLYCVGSILGGALPWDEGSGEGIALGSAFAAAEAIGQQSNQHSNQQSKENY
ncbi:MAG: anaerobic glycerol-3-phosphate dehydrogenase subunit B [Arcanobacterium sp.]|nr:anaerobic glycerol-3-phosphate dehydrogenase subunit B [Arcanobacterium sp.]